MDGNTSITITKGDGYMNIEVYGHHKEPRVCAGISAIMQTCELGLKALSNSTEGVKLEEKKYVN